MDARATAKIPRPFTTMPDPRNSNRRHRLTDIFTIALFAVMAGADGWAGVADYGRAKYAWLSDVAAACLWSMGRAHRERLVTVSERRPWTRAGFW